MSRLSNAQALKLIRESLGGSGRLTVLRHARTRMQERGFDDTDLLYAIRHGAITRCEPDMEGEDRFTLEGPTVSESGNGRRLGIVFKIVCVDPPSTVIVTALDESSRFGRRRQ